MRFFYFVAEHWIVSLAVYVILFWTTARGFCECMSRVSWSWYQKIYNYGISRQRGGFLRYHLPISWVVRFLSFLIGLAAGPIFWVLFRIDDRIETREEKKRFVQREKEYAKKEAERQQRIAEWKKANPPVLYYNAMAGVTVVMSIHAYNRVEEQTARARVNGLWQPENVLMLPDETFVFIYASALDRVPEEYRSGWVADVEDLKKVAQLERRVDIFVPFVSEAILSFQEQKERLLDLRTKWGTDEPKRLEAARKILLWQDVPPEIRNW